MILTKLVKTGAKSYEIIEILTFKRTSFKQIFILQNDSYVAIFYITTSCRVSLSSISK